MNFPKNALFESFIKEERIFHVAFMCMPNCIKFKTVIKKFNQFERNNHFSGGGVFNRCSGREGGQTLFKTEQIFSGTFKPKSQPVLD